MSLTVLGEISLHSEALNILFLLMTHENCFSFAEGLQIPYRDTSTSRGRTSLPVSFPLWCKRSEAFCQLRTNWIKLWKRRRHLDISAINGLKEFAKELSPWSANSELLSSEQVPNLTLILLMLLLFAPLSPTVACLSGFLESVFVSNSTLGPRRKLWHPEE